MPQVGFEPMIPVFKGAKTVHALDRVACMIGTALQITGYYKRSYRNMIRICELD
jgi:hypothetical protein